MSKKQDNKRMVKKSADAFKKVRLAYVYQRSEFAALLGVSYNSVYMYETGLRYPRLSTIRDYIALAAKKNMVLGLEDFQD